MKERGPHSHSVYYDRFGSWNAAPEAAGFEANDPQQAATTDELIAELQRLAEKYDQRPTTTLMNEEGAFWASTYRNHFGSWKGALEATGVE